MLKNERKKAGAESEMTSSTGWKNGIEYAKSWKISANGLFMEVRNKECRD